MDATVEQARHRLVVLVVRLLLKRRQLGHADGFAEGNMHTAFLLQDAREDAVQVFARLLGIARILRLVEFQGFQNVARLPLVADAHRDDMQVGQGLDLVLRLTHAEHLDDALIRQVDAILRATVALGYPNALLLLLDGVAHILRQVQRALVELLDVAPGTRHLEHLVAPAYIDHHGIHHEVGTKGNLGGLKALRHQIILQQAGVEHDIAMIRDIEILLVGRQAFKARHAKLHDAPRDDLFVDAPHGVVLKLPDGAKRANLLPHRLDGFVGIDIGRQQRKHVAVGNALHGSRNLLFVIRTNIFEFVSHCR